MNFSEISNIDFSYSLLINNNFHEINHEIIKNLFSLFGYITDIIFFSKDSKEYNKIIVIYDKFTAIKQSIKNIQSISWEQYSFSYQPFSSNDIIILKNSILPLKIFSFNKNKIENLNFKVQRNSNNPYNTRKQRNSDFTPKYKDFFEKYNKFDVKSIKSIYDYGFIDITKNYDLNIPKFTNFIGLN